MSDQYGNFQGVPQTPAPAPYQQPPYGRLDKGYPAAAQKPRPGITVMLALAAILVLGRAANCGLLPYCVYRFS